MVEGLTLHQAPSAFPAVPAATVTLIFRRTPPGARNPDLRSRYPDR